MKIYDAGFGILLAIFIASASLHTAYATFYQGPQHWDDLGEEVMARQARYIRALFGMHDTMQVPQEPQVAAPATRPDYCLTVSRGDVVPAACR